MLKKTYRLEVVRLNKPKTIKDEIHTVKYSDNQLDFSRFGFIISKNLDKRAVIRNSLKRKLSLSIETIFDKISSGKDYVLIPSKNTLNLSQDQLNTGVEGLLKKEKLLT